MHTYGNLGSKLMIDISNLKHHLLFNGFTNLNLVHEFLNLCIQFNMAVSSLICHNILTQSRTNFLVSIGQSKLRQNTRFISSLSS